MHIPVQGHSNLVRDTNSGAVINIGSEGDQHSANRARMKAESNRLNELENDVS
jgi:hypothetical protein